MLIKLDNERFLNSDHIRAIVPHPQKKDVSLIILSDRLQLEVSPAIVDYITQLAVETDDAAIFTQPVQSFDNVLHETIQNNMDRIDQARILSLPSRIAIILREHPNGKTFNQLLSELPGEAANISKALTELLSSNVTRVAVINGIPTYYHAATQSPDF